MQSEGVAKRQGKGLLLLIVGSIQPPAIKKL